MPSSHPEIGRWLRTARGATATQVLARVPSRLSQAAVRHLSPLRSHGPKQRTMSLPSDVRRPWMTFVESEAERLRSRTRFLSRNPHLREFEENYALDLFRRAPEERVWRGTSAWSPYVCAVRARRLAVAHACGVEGLGPEITAAARAVLLAPEFHLLGNHLLEDGIGLCAAAAVSEGPEARLWGRLGTAILHDQLPVQFGGGGFHDEGSATYHLALLAALIELRLLRRAADRPEDALLLRTIDAAWGAALRVRAPDGTYPLFNDADPLAGPRYVDVLQLAAAAALPAPRHTEAPIDICPWGWAVLRSPRAFLVVKAGPDGSPTQPGHVHADLLSLELWVDGQKVVSDPGVWSYNNDDERQRCRGSAAHNGPHLDGEDSSEVWGAFRTGRRNRASVDVATVDAGRPTLVVSRPIAGGGRLTRRVVLHEQGLDVCDEHTVGGDRRPLRATISAPSTSVVCEAEERRIRHFLRWT